MMISPPSDGWTQLERVFMRELVISVYSKIVDPIDKFILIARHESNYKQEEVAEMLGISQAAVSKRLTKVKKTMRKKREQKEL